MHQSLAAHIEPLDPRTITKLCKARDQAVVDGPTQFRLAENHLLMAKGLPCDLIAIAELVRLGEGNKYLFSPKLRDFAIRQVRSPQNEGHIQSALANERDLLARRTFQDVHFHLRVACAVSPDDFAEETGCHRG